MPFTPPASLTVDLRRPDTAIDPIVRRRVPLLLTPVTKTNSFRKPEEGYLEQADDGPVIVGHYGERVIPSTISHWWIIDRDKYDLEGYTLHELRHTYLTMLAMGGVHPKVMQELAGY